MRNALRMRPDRIILGEVRGGEALDMLQAMNTGHEGSLTTIHANDTRDALSRLEVMVAMAGFDLPVTVVRRYIASAITLVVHLARLKGGVRRVMRISEIVGLENGDYQIQDIFRFQQSGVDAAGPGEGPLPRLRETSPPARSAARSGNPRLADGCSNRARWAASRPIPSRPQEVML